MILDTCNQDLYTKINLATSRLGVYAADYNNRSEETDLNMENTTDKAFRIGNNAIANDDPELIHAAGTGDLQRVFALLYCEGTNPNITSASGMTALLQAILGIKESVGVVELLIDRGVDVNAATADGLTALMIATIKGYKHIVIRLLAAGADAHRKDIFGYNAVSLAARLGHDDITELLLERSIQ